MSNELVRIVQENQLEPTQAQVILDNFSGFLKLTNEWSVRAKALVITDISQIKEMGEAREARLALKRIRTDATKAHKRLKERPLRESRAIDGALNIVKALIIPIEEHLDKQEKFVENLENERLEKINAQRELELSKYVADISMYNYKEMSDEVFGNLILSVKKIWETEQEAVKKAEEDRVAKELEDKKEQERIRIENEKLKKEAKEKEKELEAERLKAQKEADEKEVIAQKLRKKQWEEDEKQRKQEQKEREDKLAKFEEEKQARLAPDKDKLLNFARKLEAVDVPELQTEEAKKTLSEVLILLGQAVAKLKIK